MTISAVICKSKEELCSLATFLKRILADSIFFAELFQQTNSSTFNHHPPHLQQSRAHLNQLRTSKDSRKPGTLGTFRFSPTVLVDWRTALPEDEMDAAAADKKDKIFVKISFKINKKDKNICQHRHQDQQKVKIFVNIGVKIVNISVKIFISIYIYINIGTAINDNIKMNTNTNASFNFKSVLP